MKKLLALFAFLLCLWPVAPAQAVCGSGSSTCYWNPYAVTGAVSGTAGVCRLTISPAIVGSGLVAGNAINVTSITGTAGTACNVATTISTVVDTTHIELAGTTFSGSYTSGGCVAGGQWTSTNTANWALSSTATCGSGAGVVPSQASNADKIQFDANSLAGTVVVSVGAANSTLTMSDLTTSAFTGTLDFSVNNNNVIFNGGTGGVGWTSTGASTKLKLGSGTFTDQIVAGGTFNFGGFTAGNMTAGTSTLVNTGTNCYGGLSANGLTLYNYTANCTGGNLALTGSFTLNTLTIGPGNCITQGTSGGVTTITSLVSNGTSTSVACIYSAHQSTQPSMSSASNQTVNYMFITGWTFTGGGTWTANNSSSASQYSVTGITFNPPSGGGGSVGIIGG
jgi:hypothetical protein